MGWSPISMAGRCFITRPQHSSQVHVNVSFVGVRVYRTLNTWWRASSLRQTLRIVALCSRVISVAYWIQWMRLLQLCKLLMANFIHNDLQLYLLLIWIQCWCGFNWMYCIIDWPAMYNDPFYCNMGEVLLDNSIHTLTVAERWERRI